MFNFNIKCGIVLTLLSLFFRCTDTQCSTANRFGSACEFDCHCIDNVQCNKTTGDCQTACDYAWAGPSCQHKNVVPTGSTNNEDMVTRQSSNIETNKYAPFAVDKDLSTCSYTNYANLAIGIPWWRLWLKEKHKIRFISIRSRSDYLGNFQNFKVMVENNTYIDRYGNGYYDQKLCYQHNASAPSTSFIEIQCNEAIAGNQIRILLGNIQTQLVLCDVRIYGDCKDGTYGVRCTDKCSPYCEGICNKDTGTCASCLNGWTGIYCTTRVCEDGRYGDKCMLNCSGNCKDNAICRASDGVCENGCNPGYKGAKCNQTCQEGKYGNNCAYDCSSFCRVNSKCNNIDGICLNGCSTGYRGGRCVDECSSGSYGIDCMQICSENCFEIYDQDYCSHVNGRCTYGCRAGFQGTHCNETCEDGKYGDKCTFNCSPFCRANSECNNVDGSCPDGCSAGYTGNKCNQACLPGSYGIDCKQNCSGNCLNGLDYCSHVNGSCIHGCEAGFSGTHCNESCTLNKWGNNCNESCGRCSDGERCDIRNGFCVSGCMPGYKTTSLCREECEMRSYGHNCAEKCSEYCTDKGNCNRLDGTCQTCVAGWNGEKCDIECQDGFYGTGCSHQCSNCKLGTVCNKTTGVCHDGCSSRYSGVMCDAEMFLSTEQATDSSINLSPAALTGIVIAVIILNAITAFVAIFVTRNRMQRSRTHTASESATVHYSNVLATTETSNDEGAIVYETLNKKSGAEHIYG